MSDPFHIIPAASETPLFFFGDHASRHIPDRYENLGLTGDDLTRHIAWDIGSEAVIRGLCERFDCGGIVAGFSRLLIDPNRSKRMDSLIPEASDGTLIPGNQNVSVEARAERIETLYTPDLNHTIDLHVAPRALRHLAIEIRQDHIRHDHGVAKYVKLLGDALKQIMD